MGGAANEPHPLSDIAPRAPLLKFLEIAPAHTYKIPNRWYGKSLLRKVGQGSLQLPYNLAYRVQVFLHSKYMVVMLDNYI